MTSKAFTVLLFCLSLAACGVDHSYVRENQIWIFRSSTGNGVSKTEIANVDQSTFEVIDSEYAKDKYVVYYHGLRLKDADPATFKVLSSSLELSVDKNTVFCGHVKLPNSDPSSFKILPEMYSLDKNNVYWGCEILQGADPSSFKKSGQYWQDKNNLYHTRKTIPGVNVGTLIQHSDGIWSYDDRKAYVGSSGIIPDDINTFRVIFGVYARDDKAFYAAKGAVVPRKMVVRDPESFVVIDKYWAKDKIAMYWAGEELLGVNPSTFTIIRDYAGKDGEVCYFGGRISHSSSCGGRWLW